MVANAQLKKGDIYAEQGRVDEALAAYAVVPEKYAAEAQLVENAYIRSAELIRKERGTEAAIAAYKNSIENIENKEFQARAQLTIASLLFEDEEYEKAGEEVRDIPESLQRRYPESRVYPRQNPFPHGPMLSGTGAERKT